jgi:tetratricopeptide (TPR) repeat protein
MKSTLLAIVLVITAAVYANSLTGAFQFDDVAVQGWLEGTMTDFVANEMGIAHRPLPYFTYWINYVIGGANPFGFHLVNLYVHLVSVALVFFLVDHLLGGDPISAAFGALLFAVHPFFSSSVAYIYARGSMMAAMFVFAAALAALKLPGIWKWVATPAFLALGVLCKEEALIAPALFLGYAIINGHKTAAKILLCAAALGLVGIMFTAPYVQTIFNTPLSNEIMPVPDLIMNYGAWPTVSEHLRGVLNGYAFHTLGNLLVPLHLSPDPAMVFGRQWIAAVAIILAMAALALSKKIPVDIRMALWALLCCPILGALVILVAEPLFEYRAYVLGLGVALMGGALCRRLQRLRLAPVLAALTIAALAAGTVQRNQAWATVIDLWQDAHDKDPAKKRAVLNLSAALIKARRHADAELLLQKTLDRYPAFRAAHVNLAAVYLENQKCEAGEFHARRGVPVPLAYTYIALCETQRGNFEGALANVDMTIKLDPEMIYARGVRLSLLKEMGRDAEELTALETLVAEHPKDRMAHTTLSMAYRMAGYKDFAEKHSKISKELAKEN